MVKKEKELIFSECVFTDWPCGLEKMCSSTSGMLELKVCLKTWILRKTSCVDACSRCLRYTILIHFGNSIFYII